MDDSEARYLIDQYNKYVSWNERESELFLTVWCVVLIAILSVSLALGNAVFRDIPSAVGMFEIEATALAGIVLLAAFSMRMWRNISKRYERHEKRLILLEEHRVRYRSLPDTITLNTVVDGKSNLEKLLREHGEKLLKHGTE